MTAHDLNPKPINSTRLDAQAFLAQQHARYLRCEKRLYELVLENRAWAAASKKSGSEEWLTASLNSTLSALRFLYVRAIHRLNLVQRVFPDCDSPIVIFEGEGANSIDRRVLTRLKKACERRGLKVEIQRLILPSRPFRLSVVTKGADSAVESIGLFRPSTAIASTIKKFSRLMFGAAYDRQMRLKSIDSAAQDFRLGVYSGLCLAGTLSCRWGGIFGTVFAGIRCIEIGRLEPALMLGLFVCFGMGEFLANRRQKIVALALEGRIRNPANY
jgi:hypothetical protein